MNLLPIPLDLPIATESVAVVPTEIELKLYVPASSVERLWSHPLLIAHAVGPVRVQRIDNRYFDTPDGALAAQRMALRLRRIGRRWLQTLKVARPDEGALSMRGEWEMPVAGAALELTLLKGTPLLAIGTGRALAARLKPVFTTNFRRESRLLRLKDGSELEFAFDVGTIASGRGRTRRMLPIREVEIEVKLGRPDLLKFAARLAKDLPLIPLAASKAARGHRLHARSRLEAVKVRMPEARPTDPARLHLAQVLEACNRGLLANVHGLFETSVVAPGDAIDADAAFVYQARVALRRMRSALWIFRSVAKDRRAIEVDERLQALGRSLGEARDWDVFIGTTLERLDEVVGTDAAGRDAIDVLRVAVAKRRADAHATLLQVLDTGTVGATTLAVERLVLRLREGEGDATLARSVDALLSTQRERLVKSARRIAVLDGAERHALRVEVKRLRYALELLDELFDAKSAKDYREALTDLQDKLGKLNDLVVADTLLQSLTIDPSVELVRARFATWLDRHVMRQLPKVAALSVTLELMPQPWVVPTDPGPA